jgi:hypothetical protein
MKDLLKQWAAIAALALGYLMLCGVLEARAERIQSCSVVRCA